jgi:hypothetical protein
MVATCTHPTLVEFNLKVTPHSGCNAFEPAEEVSEAA